MSVEEINARIKELIDKNQLEALATLRTMFYISVVLRDLRRPLAEQQPQEVHVDIVKGALGLHRHACAGAALQRLFVAVGDNPEVDPYSIGATMIHAWSQTEIKTGRELCSILGLFKEYEGQDPLAEFERNLKAQSK